MIAAVSRGELTVTSIWSNSASAKRTASASLLRCRYASGNGVNTTPGIIGPIPARTLTPELVSDPAPIVRPWKPPWKATMLCRPVAWRARRTDASTASLPELT